MANARIKELEDQILQKGKEIADQVKEEKELRDELDEVKDDLLEKEKEIDMLKKQAG